MINYDFRCANEVVLLHDYSSVGRECNCSQPLKFCFLRSRSQKCLRSRLPDKSFVLFQREIDGLRIQNFMVSTGDFQSFSNELRRDGCATYKLTESVRFSITEGHSRTATIAAATKVCNP